MQDRQRGSRLELEPGGKSVAQHSLEIELREGLQGLDEVHQARRFEVLASTLLGVLLKQFDARCAISLKLGAVNRDGTRQFEEVARRTAGGLQRSRVLTVCASRCKVCLSR